MRKFYFSVGLLVVLAFPLLCYSQEATQIETATLQEVASVPLGEPDEAQCDYRFELSSVGDVCFPHKSHRKLGCGTCHHQSKAKPLESPHPEYLTSSWHSCQSCHDPDTDRQKTARSCSSCHLPDPDNIADETPSSKVAIHKNCWKCHESGKGAEASKGCSDCHMQEVELSSKS